MKTKVPYSLPLTVTQSSMPKKTRQEKLLKQYQKAEECLTREDAQRIIRKADKHRRKLQRENIEPSKS